MRAKIIILISLFFRTIVCGQSVDLTTCLPDNYVVDGSVDYTEYMQKGLNEYQEATFPNFPVLINEKGLRVRNNQILNFRENSRLFMKPNAKERYALVNIVNVRNITINNPNLVGDKERHMGDKGEWGMGINIQSSKNIVINNPNISKFWGDGIYIGEIFYDERTKYKLEDYSSKEITIRGGVIDGNRRNGISVTSVKGLLIERTLIQNTDGTEPMAGICIEPSNNEQYLENIVISGVTTKNNSEVGIKYVSSNFFGKRGKNVSITIADCRDIGSKIGLFLGGARASYANKIEKLIGEITIKNFSSHSNVTPLKYGSIQKFNPTINLRSFVIYDNHGTRSYGKEKKIKSEISAKGIKVN